MRAQGRNFLAWAAIWLVATAASSVYADFEMENEKEIQVYVETFSLPFRMKQHTAAESLAYTGHSDQRIFDLIEKQLLDNYKSLGDSYDKDWASWLAKALGFSGDSKYQATLQLLQNDAPDRKLRKYAKVAIGYTAQYREWNPIIMNSEAFDAELSLSLNRYANMLRSDAPELQKLAAKRIFFEGIRQPLIIELVHYRMANPSPGTDRDTKKWLKKSLCTDCSTFGSRP